MAKVLDCIFASFLVPCCKNDRYTLHSKLAAYLQANSSVSTSNHCKPFWYGFMVTSHRLKPVVWR